MAKMRWITGHRLPKPPEQVNFTRMEWLFHYTHCRILELLLFFMNLEGIARLVRMKLLERSCSLILLVTNAVVCHLLVFGYENAASTRLTKLLHKKPTFMPLLGARKLGQPQLQELQ